MGFKISDAEKEEGPAATLWRAELKLQAMSHLLTGHEDCDDETGKAYRGVSLILEEIVERLAWVREWIDSSGKAGPE
ncbi:MAG: hypothetical protein M3Q07_16385 [Pseudobdellovibrionaceae bacterium]|nr:hypothetical protein [Pseudobdellovibrionaceae bacterium]